MDKGLFSIGSITCESDYAVLVGINHPIRLLTVNASVNAEYFRETAERDMKQCLKYAGFASEPYHFT